ncbi:MAG: hypothetical protein KGO96_10405 [Elusimicrobia bacterium]|nr:hypothetical protein [Elusimicrobiota bacterium]
MTSNECIITMTCTDRNGHRLAQKILRYPLGTLFRNTVEDRLRVNEEMMREHTDAGGLSPYVFTETLGF